MREITLQPKLEKKKHYFSLSNEEIKTHPPLL